MIDVREPEDILKSKDFLSLNRAEKSRYYSMLDELKSEPAGGEQYRRFKGERLKDYEKEARIQDVEIHSVRLNNESKNSKRMTYYITKVNNQLTIYIAGVGNHKFNGQSYLKKKMKSED